MATLECSSYGISNRHSRVRLRTLRPCADVKYISLSFSCQLTDDRLADWPNDWLQTALERPRFPKAKKKESCNDCSGNNTLLLITIRPFKWSLSEPRTQESAERKEKTLISLPDKNLYVRSWRGLALGSCFSSRVSLASWPIELHTWIMSSAKNTSLPSC